MINIKTTRMIKIEVTPIVDSEKRPSEVFHEISRTWSKVGYERNKERA
jgi:hypothetical protein